MSKKERNLMEKLEIWKRNDLPKILISHSYFKKHNSRQFEKESLIRFPDFVSIYRKR